MAHGRRFAPDTAGSRSLPGAFAVAGGFVLITMASMMVLPLAFDIYRNVKDWLLYEPEQAPPLGP